ncbi:hypothetical protein M3689_00945 [Alkalihalophilus marmarensis]|jgi:hypothetical protein|uniref:hypothetical protein n=1 Tax=Alkalihalophilus marmarensis TaxID=521377 RepID=UPI00203B6951|nr:hypothetical protein [Alkalihalophilus marmarensis]MCM3487866.1 hypothetical protein [Alkalihalophilus marmarensis]
MPVKVVLIKGRIYNIGPDDCIALRMIGKDDHFIEMSFPFHEDTQNFQLTIPEALALRNAIDQMIDIKLLEKPKER